MPVDGPDDVHSVDETHMVRVSETVVALCRWVRWAIRTAAGPANPMLRLGQDPSAQVQALTPGASRI